MKNFKTLESALTYYENKFDSKTDLAVCKINSEKYLIGATPLAIDDVVLSHIVDAMHEFDILAEDEDEDIRDYMVDSENDVVENFLEMLCNCMNIKIEYVSTEY